MYIYMSFGGDAKVETQDLALNQIATLSLSYCHTPKASLYSM